MGTRNLTMVIYNGETKVAQYGQWDGYPEGQGATILDFLKNTNLDEFKVKVKDARFRTEADDKEREEFANTLGSRDGWMTMEQSAKYHAKYPLDNRDVAGDILAEIMKAKGEIVLGDNSEFAADSLFCEWAYVVDLDSNKFEIYQGFNKTKLKKADRFYHLQESGKEYYPVKMVKSYDLATLPEEAIFCAECNPHEEEEEEV